MIRQAARVLLAYKINFCKLGLSLIYLTVLLTVPLTSLQLEFQKTARDFARKELLPYASEWDEKKHFPVETLRAAAQLGFAGLYIR